MATFRLLVIAVGASVTLAACVGSATPAEPVAMPEPIVAADLPLGVGAPMDQAVGLPEDVAVEWAELSGWTEIVIVEPGQFYGLASNPATRIRLSIEDGIVTSATAG